MLAFFSPVRRWLFLVGCLFLAGCTALSGSPQPTPTLITTPPPASAYETLAAFLQADVPERDLVHLTRQLKGIEVSRVAQLMPPTYQMRQVETFWYKNRRSGRNEQVDARLVYRSEELNLWVENGVRVNVQAVQRAAATLENELLPAVRALFGHEAGPGIDGDERINILHLKEIGGGVAGYFAAADQYVTAVNPYSNQRKMFYVSLRYASIGSDDYYGLIAHEMQHLIQWYTDPNEEYWLDEGMGELASHTAGYADTRGTNYEAAFMKYTDIQLTNFDRGNPAAEPAHYGAALLFVTYFRDRFGEEAIISLVRHPANGLAGFAAVLEDTGIDLTIEELFADWLVANYLHSNGWGEGVYRYNDELKLPKLRAAATHRRFPTTQLTTVNQYGADYIELQSRTPLTIVFTGTQQVPLVEAQPYSGDYYWATYPADKADMTLTRPFDLTTLTEATLSFWTWYEIETGWDYGYVAVSTDGGHIWTPLATQSTTLENPEGNSFGPGYTGISGGGRAPIWVQETADLTPYAGQPILLRFQYVTDEGVHEQGFIVDDIAIPELGYQDDVEAGDGGWEAAGFVRHSNVLPQTFLVQAILHSSTGVQVIPLALDEYQQGWWVLPMSREYDRAVLIVAGTTPITRHAAAYQYSITQP